MKILITGTNGFLGRNLKEHFENEKCSLHYPKREDLNLLDTLKVENYIKSNNFDVIIHSSVTIESIDQNLKMYFNIERLSEYYGKLICIGSGAEFNSKFYIPKMTEDYFGKYPPSKNDIYGYSKYVIAKNILEKKRNIFNLRVFGIYGKYEDYRRRLISNNICRILSGLHVSINKNTYFDYMYVDDFVKIVDLFINSEPKETTYNTCTGEIIDFLTIAKLINNIEVNSKNIEVKNQGMNKEYSGDNTKLKNEFENIEFTDPKICIENLYNWYKYNSKLVFDDKIFDKWIKN